MKKKIGKEDEITKQINQLHNILDKNFFHVCVSLTEENNVEWTVFYNNLDEEDYISNKNKPLLTSKRNTIADIYKLKYKFEKMKKLEKNKYCFELFKDSFNIHSKTYEIKENAMLSTLNIYLVYVCLNIIILSFVNNMLMHILNLAICILVAFYLTYKQKKINSLLDKQDNIVQDLLLRNIIKRKGLKFVKELKHEVYRNELPKREKQTKKTSSKNI